MANYSQREMNNSLESSSKSKNLKAIAPSFRRLEARIDVRIMFRLVSILDERLATIAQKGLDRDRV